MKTFNSEIPCICHSRDNGFQNLKIDVVQLKALFHKAYHHPVQSCQSILLLRES